MQNNSKNPLSYFWKEGFLFPLFLIICVWVSFWPATRAGFVFLDDEPLLIENASVHIFSLESVSRLFQESSHDFFMPLTYLSYAIEYRLFGQNAGFYHLNNIILHTANALLVYFIFKSLTRRAAPAFLTSLIFALHPLRAESVAWISDRKDLLGSFFLLSSFWVYFKSRDDSRLRAYAASLMLFACAVLSKPTMLILPMLMALTSYALDGALARRELVRLSPFFILASFFAFLAYIQQQSIIPAQVAFNFIEFTFTIVRALTFYFSKHLWPVDLNCMYYFPNTSATPLSLSEQFWLAGLIIVTIYLSFNAKVNRRAFFGWIIFLIALVPTLPLSYIRAVVADRYTYLPSIGFAYFIASAIYETAKNARVARLLKAVLASVGFVCLIYLAFSTFRQCGFWRDSLALSERVLSIDPKNQRAVLLRGNYHKASKNYASAEADYQKALAMTRRGIYWAHPSEIYNNLGTVFFEKNDDKSAEKYYSEAIKYVRSIDPKMCADRSVKCDQSFHNMGAVYERRAQYPEALNFYQTALALNPGSWKTWLRIGDTYFRLGRIPEALSAYEKALEYEPASEFVQVRVAIALARSGRADQALLMLEKYLKKYPEDFEALVNLGSVYGNLGLYEKATDYFTRAQKIHPEDIGIQQSLALVSRLSKES